MRSCRVGGVFGTHQEGRWVPKTPPTLQEERPSLFFPSSLVRTSPRPLLFFSMKAASIQPPAAWSACWGVVRSTVGEWTLMPRWLPWILAGFIVFLIGVVPVVYYRAEYAHSKRLRAIVPGQLYRS